MGFLTGRTLTLPNFAPPWPTRKLGQLGYQYDPPLVGRVPFFPKLTEAEPRKGFLKPEFVPGTAD